jgi:peptidoglycan/LPS O-acetylase OafA/YrhL
MKFRYDINALRALAVTAVVLFHFKAGFIPGGFIGVDVFFVISGYLMTSIIMGRLAKGKFDIWEFYYDRAKRIIPGLMGMCFVLLAAGYVFAEPSTYHYLGSTAISALLFFSNFRFWSATNYFDPTSDAKWFLHTWSLSVEWQFYMLYPLIIMVLYKYNKAKLHIVLILWLLACLSFALCIYFSKAEPSSAFYLLPQRAWELLAGGIVALQFQNVARKYSKILLSAGLILMLIPMAMYDQYLPWPYYWGLAPVIGTCLVIAANQPEAAAFKNPLVQITGKWSYSIYLWHWPIAVSAIYFGYTKTNVYKIGSEILILAAVIGFGGFLLALFKKIWPELAARKKTAEKRWPGVAAGAGALALTVCFAITVTVNQGFASRSSDRERQQIETYRVAAKDWDYPDECSGRGPQNELRPCQLGPANGRGTLFLGDSYTMQIYSRFVENAKLNPENSYTFLATPACPPITGIRIVHDRFNCNGFVDQAFQFAESRQFRQLVLVSNWYAYFLLPSYNICFVEGDSCTVNQDPAWYYKHLDAAFASLRDRLLEFKKRGTEIVIVGATPSSDWDVPAELAKRKFWGGETQEVEYIDRDEFEAKAAPTKSRLISLASSLGAKFIDPLDFLCDSRRCPTVDKDGVPYFRDSGHYRSDAVKTTRFQFLDDATGVSNRLSAGPMPVASNP